VNEVPKSDGSVGILLRYSTIVIPAGAALRGEVEGPGFCKLHKLLPSVPIFQTQVRRTMSTEPSPL